MVPVTSMDTRTNQKFRKSERLKYKSDFEKAYAARQSASDERLTVYVRSNDLQHSRLGLSVSGKVGNAVLRNLIRRRIKEAYRKNKSGFPTGWDIVCVVKPGNSASVAAYAQSLQQLIPKAASRRRPTQQADKS